MGKYLVNFDTIDAKGYNRLVSDRRCDLPPVHPSLDETGHMHTNAKSMKPVLGQETDLQLKISESNASCMTDSGISSSDFMDS